MRLSKKKMEEIISKELGEDWRVAFPDKSLSEVYRMVKEKTTTFMGVRVPNETKAQLEFLSSYYDLPMWKILVKLVEAEHVAVTKGGNPVVNQPHRYVADALSEFSGNSSSELSE
ncbi:MAG: hypothetical protein D6698_04095 [Gammaproteobacteria bacterium]|nr:MAG: hypothetical protein D6698_04095 [Gammaproteobacteria bacterium]